MAKIAIVDDNESWCFVLETALYGQGYEARAFSDPWRLLRCANQFDLVIVDYCIHAPRHQLELDGVALIQQVKAQFTHPPLLLLISSYFPDETPEVLQSFCPEADWVLPRPRQLSALLQPIQTMLSRRSNSRAVSGSSVA